jgi:hypothetical protein
MTTETLNCSQALRATGQLLEALNIQSFTLRVDDNDFLIRERVPRRNREIKVRESLASAWKIIHARETGFKISFHKTGVLQFRVTREDVAVVEREGQTRRQNSSKAPETGAPSQILRAIGGYVDQKKGQLLEVSKYDQNVYFEYELPSREIFIEQFTVSSLYDYWVKMYLKRTGRGAAKS